MIFQTEGSIDKIIAGTKTQTRRIAKRGDIKIGETNAVVENGNGNKWCMPYVTNKTYAVQPGRGQHGVWYNPTTGAIEAPIKSIWDIEYEMMRRDCRVGLTQNGFVPLRIRITSIKREDIRQISKADALAEGGYTPAEYFNLWLRLHHIRTERRAKDAKNFDAWAISFEKVVKP